MGPRRCQGYADVHNDNKVIECCFNPHVAKKHAQAKHDGQCMWCSPVRLRTVCNDQRLCKLAANSLAAFRRLDEEVFELAVGRVLEVEGGQALVDCADEAISKQTQKKAPADQPERQHDQGQLDDVEMEPPAAPQQPAAARGARKRPAAALAPVAPPPAPQPDDVDMEAPPPPPPPLPHPMQQRNKRLCEGYSLAGAMAGRLTGKTEVPKCVFSTAEPGKPAKAIGGKCVFCFPARMKEAVQDAKKMNHLVGDLNKLKRQKLAVYNKALKRLRRHLTVEEYKVIVTPKNCCRGAGADMCVFNTKNPGQPAFVKKTDNHTCSWCDKERLRNAPAGKKAGGLLMQLKKFQEKDEAVFAKAEGIIKEIHGDDYVAELTKKAARQHQQAAQHLRRKGTTTEEWKEVLKKRKHVAQAPHEDEEARKKYRKLVLADKKKVENSFFPEKATRKPRGRADEVPEDPDPTLPSASHSDLSKGAESYCLRGAWAMCEKCHAMQPRPLHEIDLRGDPKVHVKEKQCRFCKAKRERWVPQPEDVPKKLRGLSEEAILALRPIDVDVGKETRSTDALGRWNGYRKKVRMITFLFSEKHVKDKIKSIDDRDMRKKAKKAHEHLLADDQSKYKYFHDMHEKFLRKNGVDASERKRKRPYRFLQEVGLECALWPHLYWNEEMCETYEQWSDVRREERREAAENKKKKRAVYGYESSNSEGEEEDEEDAEEAWERTSVKRSFMAKCMSPVIGYGSNFELLQFVYDLNLWATLGGKKNLGLDNVPMRVLMKGHTFSPLYWKDVHNALVDVVRQIGLPKLFFTIAPWEPSFKYHEWLRDEMAKTLRTRMNMPVGETLHIAHILTQMVKGLLSGSNQNTQGRADRSWKKHVFATKDSEGKPTRVYSFTRLEFQDGSRKEGTKRYDGSGRPHLHVLFFADDKDLESMKLEKHLFATKPDDFSDELKGYVDGSQKDRYGKADSKWPVDTGEPGYFDERLHLYHTEQDKDDGLRAFCADLMDALPCHQDWQVSDGEAMLLQYVSKYVSKFSDASYDEWMNDHASADSVARRVCFEYHPYEPEMILQLCGAQFRQYDVTSASGGFRSVTAPYAGMEHTPAFVEKYCACPWRHEKMTLLEWLRKTNDEGEIAGWLKAKHKDHTIAAAYEHHLATENTNPLAEQIDETAFRRGLRKRYKKYCQNEREDAHSEPWPFVKWLLWDYVDCKRAPKDKFPSLQKFASEYVMRGEKLVAVDTVYELNDRYYGQWAAMNVPFRSLDELRDEEVERLVPRMYKHLATALRLCCDHNRVASEFHDLFVNEDRLKDYMKAAASTDKFIANVHRMIVGQRKLIDMYLAGILDKNDEKAVADAEADILGNRRQARDDAQSKLVVFNRKQLLFEEAINESVDRALKANHAEDWEEADDAREEAFRWNKPIICLGKPGTGKTTVVKSCIRRAQEKGARVLFALPTAQLASRMRASLRGLDDVEVATCHAAFKLNEPITEALPLMTMYDMVVVDEVSLLDCPQFERMVKLWSVAEKVPALVFLGDKWQLPGVGETRAWESTAWKKPKCYHVQLDQTWRCKEERFQHILDEIRTSVPSKETLQMICRGHKAWKRGSPSPADLKTLYERHPDTNIVTCTRKGAAQVNDAALEAKFGRKKPLVTLDGDPELNPENYFEGKFRTDRRPIPSAVPIFKGMSIYLTKNVRKEDDYVNGMQCTVENYHEEEGMLRVKTKSGKRLAVTPWTDRDKQNVVYYPLRLGYASTIDKVQGDEFPHITIYLDGYPRPAAGYTALSRVATSDCYLIGGHVARESFTPAF